VCAEACYAEEPPRSVELDIPLAVKAVNADASSVLPPGKEKDEDFSAKNAIDGKLNTQWASEPGEPQHIILGLDTDIAADKLIITWGPSYASSYSVEVSGDGSIWTGVFSTETGRGGTETVTFPLSKARYIKLTFIKNDDAAGFRVREISVYGKKKLVLF